ncbi:MAG: hypothetical protein LBJ02_05330 [Bifidobacteriaceae bacterium]|jgi:hypothetical protein|nr:hypothetical protein [Bifidobacteriaceae bacterium]
MSTGFVGGDVDQLRDLARTFEHVAERLEMSRKKVDGEVKVVPWFGQSARTFQQDWAGTMGLSARLTLVSAILRTTRKDLQAEANDQERASQGERSTWGWYQSPSWSSERKEYERWGHALEIMEAAQEGLDPPAPYRRMTEAELREMGVDPAALDDEGWGSTGFSAEIYVGPAPDNQVIVAYPGTADGNDWGTNVMGSVFLTAQDKMAIKLASRVQQAWHDSELMFVGHSHGGRLAALGSVATGCEAITLNAEGTSKEWLQSAAREGNGGTLPSDWNGFVQEAAGRIKALHTAGDPLTGFERGVLRRGTFGESHEIPYTEGSHHDVSTAQKGVESLITGAK